jgi:hypothetical protein
MTTQKNKLLLVLFFISLLISCTKQSRDSGPFPLSDIKPAIPVTVQNAAAYRPEPTVTTSISGGGAIQIVLTIPASSKRSIKEITKIATPAASTYTQIQSTGTTGFYNTAPIAGAGTSVTFNTSLTEYFVKNPVSSSNPAAKANTELARRFYFLVTLDDSSIIITEPVRVLALD